MHLPSGQLTECAADHDLSWVKGQCIEVLSGPCHSLMQEEYCPTMQSLPQRP